MLTIQWPFYLNKLLQSKHDFIVTLWVSSFYRIIIYLKSGVYIGSSEAHYMVFPVINFCPGITNGNIFRSQVVVQEYFSTILEKYTKFSSRVWMIPATIQSSKSCLNLEEYLQFLTANSRCAYLLLGYRFEQVRHQGLAW